MNSINKQLLSMWEQDKDETARKLLADWKSEKDWGIKSMLENKMLSYLEEKGLCSKDLSSD